MLHCRLYIWWPKVKTLKSASSITKHAKRNMAYILNLLHSKHLKCSSYAILILRSRQINGRIFCHSIRIGGTECIWVFGFIMISNSWPRKLNIWLMIYYMSPTNFEYIPCRDGMPDMDRIKKESFLINL